MTRRREVAPGTGSGGAANRGTLRGMKRFAPAAERNKGPIADVLARVFLPLSHGLVVEIATGSGQHLVHFARLMPHLEWQPTDPDPDALASVRAWVEEETLPNVRPPLQLDARDPSTWPNHHADAFVCSNMIHIAPWSAAVGLIEGAGARLRSSAAHRGALVLYGPFMIDGRHTAASNAAFDEDLRVRNPEWGVRDLDDVLAVAHRNGLELVERVAMPANNFTVVLAKG